MITSMMRMATLVLAAGLSGTAQAALQARDLDGNAATAEAYYDTVLDITWLADANYAKTSGYDADGLMHWDAANTWAASLSFTDGVNVYDDWRLPTAEPVNGVSFNYFSSYDGSTDVGYNITSPQNELSYMFYVNLGNPGEYAPGGEDSGCYVSFSDSCLDNVGPFSDLQSFLYYAGPESGTNTLWVFNMSTGEQFGGDEGFVHYAWAVHSGDVAAVPEADTWAMLLAGLALIGAVTQRRKQAKV